jgi:hypothetical protein
LHIIKQKIIFYFAMKKAQIISSLFILLPIALFISTVAASSKFAQQDKGFSAWKGKNGKEYDNEIESELRY